MNQSVIANKTKPFDFKAKNELKRLAEKYMPNRRFRVMTDEKDARAQGHKVALLEEIGTDGKLVFVQGAPNLSMAGDFLRVKFDTGQLK